MSGAAFGMMAAGKGLDQLNSYQNMQFTYKRQRSLRRKAYQDTMSSMRAAGLNPILAYGQGPTAAQGGGGATSGSGGSAWANNHSALEAAQTQKESRKVMRMQRLKIKQEIEESKARASSAKSVTYLNNMSGFEKEVLNKILIERYPAMKSAAQFESNNPWMWKTNSAFSLLNAAIDSTGKAANQIFKIAK